MICAACGHDNRHGAKFCTECGAALARACRACGTPVEPGEKFCAECGSVLASETSVRASLSPDTAPVSGEKKQITVLFADVAGSMDLQERLDAEVWAQIMGRFVSILAEGVRRFGGTVDKFTGDGIMALFGAPVAQEDHARRACHAAWHLTKAIGEYSEELRRDQAVELQVRLGLNSGEVVVGRVGDDVTLDPTALGHAVGLAQRMETMADPGTTYLTSHTARLVEDWFDVKELGPALVKGARDPLGVYELIGRAPSVSRRRRGAGSPLVGREREIAVLRDALAAAEDGSIQVVGVVGEAGVGKSRLCEEFGHAAVGRGVTVHHTTGVSHGQDMPLLPILSLLRSYFGVNEADDTARVSEQVSRRLMELDPALEGEQPVVLDFLGIVDQSRPPVDLPAPVRLRRILATLHRIATVRSEQGETLVLMAEDLQWFDPQSLAFLERLIEGFAGSRTMVLTNFRPEFSGSWMRHSYYRELALGPLPPEAAGDLLQRLLGDHTSTVGLVSPLVERTGGNPFFLEEMVRGFEEDGTLTGRSGDYRLACSVNEAALPATVHAVLAARIDRQAYNEKLVLQTAAILGRSFSSTVLAKMSGVPQPVVDDTLVTLCQAELVQQSVAQPDQYRFWHPLTQQVAYGTLLAERRAGLHAAAARAIADGGPERTDERAALVAWHYERAGDALETARWNARAATWTLRTDLNEAVRRWRATIALLDRAVETEDSLRLAVEARGRLLQIGARIGLPTEEATRFHGEAKDLAERLGNRTQLAAITRFAASVVLLRGELRVARDRYFEAVRLADETDDPEFQASVRYCPAMACFHVGPVDAGLTAAERTMSLCGDDVDFGARHVGYSPLIRSRAHRAELLALAGRLPEAENEAVETLGLARRRYDLEAVAWLLTILVRLSERAGTANPDALAWAGEAVRITEETGNFVFHVIASNALASTQILARRFGEAGEIARRSLEHVRGPERPRFDEVSTLTVLARAYLGLGDISRAVEFAHDAVETARHQGAGILECWSRLIRARVALAACEPATEPCADLEAALGLMHETGALTYEPFIREERGRLRNDEDELREARQLYRQIGATGHARRLEAELDGGSGGADGKREAEDG